jgi:hypothetical protein
MRSHFKTTHLLLIGLVLSLTANAPLANAQGRKDKPSGAEIAQKAKKVKLNAKKTVKAEKNGKTIAFTPVDTAADAGSAMNDAVGYNLTTASFTNSPASTQTDSLASGQVIGQLDTTQAGDETPLDPGVYNIMVAQVNGVWSSYVESNGEIIGEYTDVDVQAAAAAAQDPVITPDWDLKTPVPAATGTGSYPGGARHITASWSGFNEVFQPGALNVVTVNKLKGLMFSDAATKPLDKILSTAALTLSGLELKTTTALVPAETKVEAQVPDATGAIKQIVLNLRPSPSDLKKVIVDFSDQPPAVAAKLNDPFAEIKFAVKNVANSTASTPFKTTLAKKK